MAKYIEFVGVPGVGKTTTYNYLRNKSTQTENFFLFDVEPQDKKIFNKLINKLLEHTPYKAIASKNGNKKDILEKFTKCNPDLIQLFWKSIYLDNKCSEEDVRFNRVEYITKILVKTQMVKEAKSKKYYLVDEGIIHAIKHFTVDSPNISYEQQICKILSIIDLPYGVVYFDGNINTIVQRTLSREKIMIPKDKNLTRHELIKSRLESLIESKISIDSLKSYNVPVLHLDAEESIEDKSKKIIDFIEYLEVN